MWYPIHLSRTRARMYRGEMPFAVFIHMRHLALVRILVSSSSSSIDTRPSLSIIHIKPRTSLLHISNDAKQAASEATPFHLSADATAHGTNVPVAFTISVTAATETVEYVHVQHVREETESRRAVTAAAGRGGRCRPCRAGEGGWEVCRRPPRLLLLASATDPTAIVYCRSRPTA